MEGVWIDPVIAQVMMTLLANACSLREIQRLGTSWVLTVLSWFPLPQSAVVNLVYSMKVRIRIVALIAVLIAPVFAQWRYRTRARLELGAASRF